MSSATSKVNLFRMDGTMSTLGRKRGYGLILGLVILALAAFGVMAVMSATGPNLSEGLVAGVEAGSARWTAVGEHFAALQGRDRRFGPLDGTGRDLCARL